MKTSLAERPQAQGHREEDPGAPAGRERRAARTQQTTPKVMATSRAALPTRTRCPVSGGPAARGRRRRRRRAATQTASWASTPGQRARPAASSRRPGGTAAVTRTGRRRAKSSRRTSVLSLVHPPRTAPAQIYCTAVIPAVRSARGSLPRRKGGPGRGNLPLARECRAAARPRCPSSVGRVSAIPADPPGTTGGPPRAPSGRGPTTATARAPAPRAGRRPRRTRTRRRRPCGPP